MRTPIIEKRSQGGRTRRAARLPVYARSIRRPFLARSESLPVARLKQRGRSLPLLILEMLTSIRRLRVSRLFWHPSSHKRSCRDQARGFRRKYSLAASTRLCAPSFR